MAKLKITIGRDFDTWATVTLDKGTLTIQGTSEQYQASAEVLLVSMYREEWTAEDFFLQPAATAQESHLGIPDYG